MKVLKFGGTSVGSIESIKNVKKIVESCQEPVIVVVSALGGITDKLIETARKAAGGDATYSENFSFILTRHTDIIRGVVPQEKQKDIFPVISTLLDELGNIFRGVFLIKDLSPKTFDTIVSYGERLSSVILSGVINGAKHYDSRQFIKTENQFGKHIVDFEATNELIRKTFVEIPDVALMGGFISSDRTTNDVTNLGRGGSDYTAAILAAALHASQLEIWTDVDGFMTADPRVISNAYVI
ncbi:MAG: bifunctional aspartate kinase/homoserine dehydrogenase I, partial [Bacteroidaceae bacterium]|nr:bifunctional aspartate kinase/homoserine dehydrogenase I [Bacteroidaceae bacterium]